MKKTILPILLLAFALSLNAQITIKGKIANEKNEPLPYVSVALVAAKDSHLIKGALTDDNGVYIIPSVAVGNYRILASAVGFDKTYTALFTVNENNTSATVDITLKEATQMLDEAVVTATRPLFEQKADRLVVNVANSPVAAGGTAMEILQKVPGVLVIQERVTLGGNKSVQIWIDGKPSQYTDINAVLRDMPGDQIDRIELITQPGAKYDAAGGPILNIILKRNAELGFTGTANLALGGSTYDQNDVGRGQKNYYRVNPSVNLNYRSGLWNIFGSYSAARRRVFTVMNIERYIGEEVYLQDNYNEIPVSFHNFRAGADFYATKKTTLGVLLRGWSRHSEGDANNVTNVFNKDLSKQLNSFVTDNATDSRRSNMAVNFNAKHEFDGKTGHTLNFDIDYNRFNTRDISDLSIYKNEPNSVRSLSQQDLDQPINIIVGKMDYSLPFDSTSKADMGLKSSYAIIDNNLIFSRTGKVSVGESNDFLYKENINAAYINLSKKMGKLEFNAGLRTEQTIVSGESMDKKVLDRNYLQWFPSASALYRFSEKGLGLQASYSKRVNRPGFQQQNPFSFFIDSLTYTRGNPSLLPESQHVGQLMVVYNGQPVAGVSYTRTNDVIIENAPRLEGTKTFTTAENLATYENWTFQLNFPIKFRKWLDGYGGNQLIHNKYTAQYLNTDYIADRWHWLAYAGLTVKLPNDWKIEGNGWYMTRFLNEFLTIGQMGGIYLGVSKTFLNKRARLSVNFNDILYSQITDARIDFQNVIVAFKQRNETRNIRVALSYQFGNTKVKSARNRRTGSENETSRVKIE